MTLTTVFSVPRAGITTTLRSVSEPSISTQSIPGKQTLLSAKNEVQLKLVRDGQAVMTLASGARGPQGLAGKDGAQGAPGVVVVALPEVAQIDGGAF